MEQSNYFKNIGNVGTNRRSRGGGFVDACGSDYPAPKYQKHLKTKHAHVRNLNGWQFKFWTKVGSDHSNSEQILVLSRNLVPNLNGRMQLLFRIRAMARKLNHFGTRQLSTIRKLNVFGNRIHTVWVKKRDITWVEKRWNTRSKFLLEICILKLSKIVQSAFT